MRLTGYETCSEGWLNMLNLCHLRYSTVSVPPARSVLTFNQSVWYWRVSLSLGNYHMGSPLHALIVVHVLIHSENKTGGKGRSLFLASPQQSHPQLLHYIQSAGSSRSSCWPLRRPAVVALCNCVQSVLMFTVAAIKDIHLSIYTLTYKLSNIIVCMYVCRFHQTHWR